jgi:rare lipoprotein A
MKSVLRRYLFDRLVHTVGGKLHRLNSSSSFLLLPSVLLLAAGALLSGCATAPSPPRAPRPAPPVSPQEYVVAGETYRVMGSSRGYVETGMASWYGEKFHGRKTSSGEVYDMEKFTAAHRTLPLGTYVKVKRVDGKGDTAVVKVNDRGPFVDDRIIDLSRAAARQLFMLEEGVAEVTVTALGEEVFRGKGGVTLRPRPDYGRGSFSVQVGAFTVKQNAQRLVKELKQVHGTADISMFDRGDELFFRVRVGRFQSRGDAEQFRDSLVGRGEFTQAFVVAR